MDKKGKCVLSLISFYLLYLSSSPYLIFLHFSLHFSPSIPRSSNPLPESIISFHPPHPLLSICAIKIPSLSLPFVTLALIWLRPKGRFCSKWLGSCIGELSMEGGSITRFHSSVIVYISTFLVADSFWILGGRRRDGPHSESVIELPSSFWVCE